MVSLELSVGDSSVRCSVCCGVLIVGAMRGRLEVLLVVVLVVGLSVAVPVVLVPLVESRVIEVVSKDEGDRSVSPKSIADSSSIIGLPLP